VSIPLSEQLPWYAMQAADKLVLVPASFFNKLLKQLLFLDKD
jgi:hypothetical protein